MCARFTVLSDTPIAAAIAGWAIPLSRNNTIWMRWRCAAGIFQRNAVFSIGFAAFDHLFSPNQMAQANHTSGEENSPRLSVKNPDSSRYGGSIRRRTARHASAWRASRRSTFRETKSSWRVDLLANGLTVHDRHGLACRTPFWLRWDSLGRRRWRDRGGSCRRDWLGRRWRRMCRGYLRWRRCGLGNGCRRRRRRGDDRLGRRRER